MPDVLQQLLSWSTEQTVNAQTAANSTSTAVAAKPDSTVAASTSTAAAPVPEKKLDTAILDHIMGKTEAVMMREKLAIAIDEEQDLNERIMAMDDFEMVSHGSIFGGRCQGYPILTVYPIVQLIESIDNAKDMQNMGMWPKVLNLLTDKQDPIIKLACWICGTAIQNNPKAQEAVSIWALDIRRSLIFMSA